jgi:hypothetical protein
MERVFILGLQENYMMENGNEVTKKDMECGKTKKEIRI